MSVSRELCLETSLRSSHCSPAVWACVNPQKIQLRARVTQVNPPKQQKLAGPKQTKREPPTIKPSKSKLPTRSKKIDWSTVDLSRVTPPTPTQPEPQLHFEDGRTHFKHPHSRKVYLHTLYTNLILRHPVLLFFNAYGVNFHELTKVRLALAKEGAHMTLIRRRVFISSLRVAEYMESTYTRPYEMWDPSGLAMHAEILSRQRTAQEHEMKALLKGSQVSAVYFNGFNWRPESIEPAKIVSAIRILEKTGKTPIVGARFQRTVATAEDVKRLRDISGIESLRSELVGVLGGTAQVLAGTLSAPSGGLAFTLERRKEAMENEKASTNIEQ